MAPFISSTSPEKLLQSQDTYQSQTNLSLAQGSRSELPQELFFVFLSGLLQYALEKRLLNACAPSVGVSAEKQSPVPSPSPGWK